MDRATPNLPARDLAATAGFYAGLGFEEVYRDTHWMILARGQAVLEFFGQEAVARVVKTSPKLIEPA